MAEANLSGALQADLTTRHERGLRARRAIDMERVRGMNFIPKSKDSWYQQYLYTSDDQSAYSCNYFRPNPQDFGENFPFSISPLPPVFYILYRINKNYVACG